MFRKAFSLGGLLFLAGTMVLVTPGLGEARGGGGGHGGGGHGGGGHGGGGGFHGGGHGGFSRGGFYGHSYGHYGYRYGGYGYGGYGYGAYYPDYGGYNYGAYDSGLGGVTYDSGYSGSYEDEMSYSLRGYQSVPPAADNSARVTVTLPPGARVSFGGKPTTSTGSVREYQSPPLTPGRQYTYEVQASWNENGKEVTQTQQVEVTAGAHVNTAFPIASAQKR